MILKNINKIISPFGIQIQKVGLVKKYSSLDGSSQAGFQIPRLIRENDFGSLYACKYGLNLFLNPESYVERKILENNVWEKESTIIVQKLVSEGNIVIDVGANFGYFSLMCAKLVGERGKVFSSEPTAHFRDKFLKNLGENNLKNIELLPFGFSDKDCDLDIQIDASTASMHMPENDPYIKRESIKLTTLDQFVINRDLKQLDFIKVDIDGHEPLFLKGAEQTIQQFKPDILIEINPLNYYLAGVAIWDFYDQIKDYGYNIYHEKNIEEITNKIDFLKRCGNFGWQSNWQAPFSLNVLLTSKSSDELFKVFK
jgi:FkbM family methyltransferase